MQKFAVVNPQACKQYSLVSNAESKLNLFVSLQEIKKKTLQGTFEQVSINTININADIEHESYSLNAMLILFHMHLHEYFT